MVFSLNGQIWLHPVVIEILARILKSLFKDFFYNLFKFVLITLENTRLLKTTIKLLVSTNRCSNYKQLYTNYKVFVLNANWSTTAVLKIYYVLKNTN